MKYTALTYSKNYRSALLKELRLIKSSQVEPMFIIQLDRTISALRRSRFRVKLTPYQLDWVIIASVNLNIDLDLDFKASVPRQITR